VEEITQGQDEGGGAEQGAEPSFFGWITRVSDEPGNIFFWSVIWFVQKACFWH